MKNILFLLGLLLAPLAIEAQVPKYKAMFTLNFIRYIGWPEETKSGDFVIGVIRDKELADWIREQSSGKKFGFQDVVVKEYKSVEELEDCQVIFITSAVSFSRNAAVIQSKTKGSNTLIITEAEGATQNGSMINFVVRDEKLKFELHKGNASKSGLQFSSKLETMPNAINL